MVELTGGALELPLPYSVLRIHVDPSLMTRMIRTISSVGVGDST